MRITKKGEPDKRCGPHARSSKVNWDEIVPLFGTISDAEIGRRYGISRERVRQVRNKHGQSKHVSVLREQVLPLLGTMPDNLVAEKFGIGTLWVGILRRRLGIAPYPKYDYSQIDPLLGTVSDFELAKRIGASPTAVYAHRKKKGIPAKPLGKGIDWDHEPNLGKVPDKFLAEYYGVCTSAVFQARSRRGVPSFSTWQDAQFKNWNDLSPEQRRIAFAGLLRKASEKIVDGAAATQAFFSDESRQK